MPPTRGISCLSLVLCGIQDPRYLSWLELHLYLECLLEERETLCRRVWSKWSGGREGVTGPCWESGYDSPSLSPPPSTRPRDPSLLWRTGQLSLWSPAINREIKLRIFEITSSSTSVINNHKPNWYFIKYKSWVITIPENIFITRWW